jgi:hypothetical protein
MKRQRVQLADKLLSKYVAEPVVKMRFRYSCGVIGTYNITAFAMLSCLMVGASGVGATDLAVIISSARLKRVELVANAPVVATAALTTIGLTWGGSNVPISERTDSANSTVPARLTSSPPPNSSAGWWITPGSAGLNTTLFTISVTSAAGTTPSCFCDVFLDVVLADGVATTVTATTSTTGDGVVYTPYLDAFVGTVWNANPKWAPVGRVTHV